MKKKYEWEMFLAISEPEIKLFTKQQQNVISCYRKLYSENGKAPTYKKIKEELALEISLQNIVNLLESAKKSLPFLPNPIERQRGNNNYVMEWKRDLKTYKGKPKIRYVGKSKRIGNEDVRLIPIITTREPSKASERLIKEVPKILKQRY